MLRSSMNSASQQQRENSSDTVLTIGTDVDDPSLDHSRATSTITSTIKRLVDPDRHSYEPLETDSHESTSISPSSSNNSHNRHHSNSGKRRRHRKSNIADDDMCCNILPGLVTFMALAAFIVGGVLVIPYIFYDSLFWIVVHDTVGLAELILLLTSYFKCMRTSPGIVASDWYSHLMDKDREFIMSLEPNKLGKPRFCHTCGTYKPPRAHHSSIHNKCVLKMDHYCVWVNNVVGCFNHKFFFLFLFYAVVGLAHFYLVAGIGLYKFAVNFDTYNPVIFICLLIFSVFMCPISIMVTCFMGWQVFLILTNQTSIEFHNNNEISIKMKNKQGKRVNFKHIYKVNMMDNIKNFLGSNMWHWFLPTKFDGSDGIHFPTVALSEVKRYQAYSIEAQLESEGEDGEDEQHPPSPPPQHTKPASFSTKLSNSNGTNSVSNPVVTSTSTMSSSSANSLIATNTGNNNVAATSSSSSATLLPTSTAGNNAALDLV